MRYIHSTYLKPCDEFTANTVPLRKRHRRSTHVGTLTRPGRSRAKVLHEEHVDLVLRSLREVSSAFESDQLKVLLSARAGLRACEIAGITIDAFLDPGGKIADAITIDAKISKSRESRTIPMHPDIRKAVKLMQHRVRLNPGENIAYSRAGNGLRPQSANTVAQWFRRAYLRVGLQGCSSHSGRRTFVTSLARRANQFGHSLRDVQYLAGHANLDTTAAYIDQTPELDDLVASLGINRRDEDDDDAF